MPDYLEIFQDVRQAIDPSFSPRRDSITDLLNALSRNNHASSVLLS